LHPVQWLYTLNFITSVLVETVVVSGAIGRLIGGYAIALAEPGQQVAIAAAAAAKGFEFGLA